MNTSIKTFAETHVTDSQQESLGKNMLAACQDEIKNFLDYLSALNIDKCHEAALTNLFTDAYVQAGNEMYCRGVADACELTGVPVTFEELMQCIDDAAEERSQRILADLRGRKSW